MLAKALGVNQLLVVVNKLDATDPPWSEERYEAIKAEVGPFLARTGFRPKKVRCAIGCDLRSALGVLFCVVADNERKVGDISFCLSPDGIAASKGSFGFGHTGTLPFHPLPVGCVGNAIRHVRSAEATPRI